MERGSHNSLIKMKKAIFFFAFVLFVSLVSLGSSSSGIKELIITEVQISPNMFIELYNPSSEEINLDNTEIKKIVKTGTQSILVSKNYFKDRKILPKQYILIVGTEKHSINSSLIDISFPKSYSYTKDNTLIVYHPEIGIIDKVGFGSSPFDYLVSPVSSPSMGKSLVRKFNTETNTYQNAKNNAEDFFICDKPKPKEFNTECYQATQPETQNPPQNTTPTPPPQQDTTQNTAPITTPTQTQNSSQESITLAPLKIDLNTATAKELEKLTGVGPATAQEIINKRPFCSLEDLLKVKGIGPATLEKIKNQNLAYVEPCEIEEVANETDENQEEQQKNTSTTTPIKKQNTSTESVINLGKQQEIKESITGKVVYQSKTETVRKFAIPAFFVLLWIIIFLIIKR